MTENVGWQLIAARLPAQRDAAAKLSVPHPAYDERQPWHLGPVGQRDRAALPGKLGEKRIGILADGGKLLGRHVGDIVGRPARRERYRIGGQTLTRRLYKPQV